MKIVSILIIVGLLAFLIYHAVKLINQIREEVKKRKDKKNNQNNTKGETKWLEFKL